MGYLNLKYMQQRSDRPYFIEVCYGFFEVRLFRRKYIEEIC